MKRLIWRTLLTFVATLGLIPPQADAAELPVKRPTSVAAIWSRTELYLGSQKPDGTSVSEAEISQFIDTEVTPRFPDGLTLLPGYGQFKNSSGTIIREKFFVLILFCPSQTLDTNKKIQELRQAYKKAYFQESVLRADGYSIISF